MKAVLAVSLLVLSSCVSGRSVTQVTSYGASDLPREVVFIADEKASIHKIELMKRCAKGVASVGIKVLSQDCDNCLRVNLQTETVASQEQTTGGLTTGFAYGNPNFMITNSVPSGTVTVITKKAEITVSRSGKDVHGMTLVSTSRRDGLLSVIGSMCAAGFKNFPKSLDDQPVVTREIR